MKNLTITVVRRYSPGTSSDGQHYDWTKREEFDFGNLLPRNLVSAVRFMQGETGYEGYGAPVYAYDLYAGDTEVTTDQIEDLDLVIRDPSELDFGRLSGTTLTQLAKDSVQKLIASIAVAS